MPNPAKPNLSIAFDMYGCPHACRHCWLGSPAWRPMDEEVVFASFAAARQLADVNVQYIAPDWREPHMAPHYSQLYARCDAVNGCRLEAEHSFGLLNLRRIVEDPHYAGWAAARGIRSCQLKWFGIGAVNDFFYGWTQDECCCKHSQPQVDSLLAQAVDVLLAHKIAPRWQIYLTSAGAPQLQRIWQLSQEWELPRRVQQLGADFDIHVLAYDADGRGYDQQHLRMQEDEQHFIPDELWQSTTSKFGRYELRSERQWRHLIGSKGCGSFRSTANHWLWFFVTANWDVYPNYMGPAPWWKLGNLSTDTWQEIWQRFQDKACIGLQAMNSWTDVQLAEAYGDPEGTGLFDSPWQVADYWLGHACRDAYARQASGEV